MSRLKLIILTLFCMICLSQYSALGQTTSNTVATQTKASVGEIEVLRLEELGRQRSLKGETSWDDMMADGAYLIQFDGSVMTYKTGSKLPLIPLKSFELRDLIAREYGNSVTVTGLAEVSGETPDKKSFSYQMRYINVWRKKKTGKGWEIVVTARIAIRPPAK